MQKAQPFNQESVVACSLITISLSCVLIPKRGYMQLQAYFCMKGCILAPPPTHAIATAHTASSAARSFVLDTQLSVRVRRDQDKLLLALHTFVFPSLCLGVSSFLTSWS